MTLRALIIDDEPLAHKVILEYAREVDFIQVVGQCYRASEATPILQRQAIDLIFLDIQLPKLTGLDFLRTLPRRPLVIVVSAYAEYALESFELDVVDYLHKPYGFDRFLKAVNKALHLHTLQQRKPVTDSPAAAPPPATGTRPLFLKTDKRYVQIDTADIYYLASYGNYVKVWLADRYYLTPGTLRDLAAELPQADFLRVHKSYVIQLRRIDYLEGNTLVLKNSTEIPVGKKYREGVRRHVEERSA